MLAELKMTLETEDADFGYYRSSNMQGVLMEQIDPDYAGRLHEQGLNPYSQYVYQSRGECQWIVHTLTREAYDHIIVPLQDPAFQSFSLKKKEDPITISRKELKTVTKKSLLDEFYASEGSRYLSVEFLTPAAFRQNGIYINYPDLRLIFQSLMNKYSASNEEFRMFDEETLDQLRSNLMISRYRMQSAVFPMEGVKIPGFTGKMTIRVGGTKTMANYARMLLRFGEYSGVGIKTGMGMGAVRLEEKEKL